MARRVVDPLQHNVPITDAEGRPTPQFIRQWQTLVAALKEARERIAELEDGA